MANKQDSDQHKRAKRKAAARRARTSAINQVGARRLALADGRVPSIFDQPHKELLTEPEAVEFLRLDILHPGNEAAAHDALMRLVDEKRALHPIVYSGKGGGRRVYPRKELEEFIQRQRGLRR